MKKALFILLTVSLFLNALQVFWIGVAKFSIQESAQVIARCENSIKELQARGEIEKDLRSRIERLAKEEAKSAANQWGACPK